MHKKFVLTSIRLKMASDLHTSSFGNDKKNKATTIVSQKFE